MIAVWEDHRELEGARKTVPWLEQVEARRQEAPMEEAEVTKGKSQQG
jgi:hypothetical protein